MSDPGGRTRREILADAAKVAAAASVAGLAGCFPDVGGRWPTGTCVTSDAGAEPDAGTPTPVTPTVVAVSNPDSLNARKIIQPDVVAAMLDAGLVAMARQAALFNPALLAFGTGDGADGDAAVTDADGGADGGVDGGQGDFDNPWKILLPNYRPGMRIGLKVNCLNSYLATSPALVRAIVTSLRDKLGVDPSHILVWDRRLDELNRHGKYSATDLVGARLVGTLLNTAPDAGVGDTAPGYGALVSRPVECSVPRLSRILTDLTDLTINCPVLKTHGVSGVTAAMKNIYGIIDIPGSYHRPLLETALPKLYALPAIRNSISLTICDALIAVVNGDTDASPNDWPGRIFLAQDPVALDSYALDFVNQRRAAMSLAPVDATVTRWIDNAVGLGLGSKNYSLVQV